MNEIRITLAEALRVKEELARYNHYRYGGPFTLAAEEDLVNRIGEVYETALARAIREEAAKTP